MAKNTTIEFCEYKSPDTGNNTLSLKLEIDSENPRDLIEKLTSVLVMMQSLFPQEVDLNENLLEQ
jgi:hypothetical protein